MRKLPVAALAAATLVILSGCSAPSAATRAAAVQYRSLADLKTAYVGAGGRCPTWLEDDDIQAAAQSGTCGDGSTLSTYLNSADLRGQVKLLRDTASGGDDGSSAPRTELLIGTNWLVSGTKVRQLQAKLGGQLAVINPAAAN